MGIIETIKMLAKEEGVEEGLEQGVKRGIEKGIEKGLELGLEQGLEQTLAIQKLLVNSDFGVEEIAERLNVSVSFVDKVKTGMQDL